MADHLVPAICLRCGHALSMTDDLQGQVTFFECQACGRRYSRQDGQGLVFRWPHPIGVALYSYLFRCGSEQHHVSTAVCSLVDGRSQEEIAALIHEIELELDHPTQQIHLILEGLQASEVECRDFLRTVVGRLRQLQQNGSGIPEKMCEVIDEIDRAVELLQLTSSVNRLPLAEAEDVNRQVLARFADGNHSRWWWESFPESQSAVFDDGLGYQRISMLVPDANERCWFIVESHASSPYSVYDASPADIASILGECFCFEYYIVPRDFSWLICENHHGVVIGCGEPIESRIKAMAGT